MIGRKGLIGVGVLACAFVAAGRTGAATACNPIGGVIVKGGCAPLLSDPCPHKSDKIDSVTVQLNLSKTETWHFDPTAGRPAPFTAKTEGLPIPGIGVVVEKHLGGDAASLSLRSSIYAIRAVEIRTLTPHPQRFPDEGQGRIASGPKLGPGLRRGGKYGNHAGLVLQPSNPCISEFMKYVVPTPGPSSMSATRRLICWPDFRLLIVSSPDANSSSPTITT